MKYCILVFLLPFYLNVSAQVQDSSVFRTNDELNGFILHLSTNKPDHVKFLCLINGQGPAGIEISRRIDEFVKELKLTGIESKPLKKQVKTIYTGVHNKFLKKYSEKAFFSEIFASGEYNCVSASALIAIVLDHFSIPYAIKETPVHVYILADPGKTQIRIETTMPAKGVVVWDESFKKRYVDYLHNSKMISDAEYATGSVNDLFEKMYNTDNTINLIEIGAIQYYNQGVFYYNEKKYQLSSEAFEKAALLYPSKNILFMLNMARLNVFNEHLTTKKYDGKLLAKYLNSERLNEQSKVIGAEYFAKITEELIIARPNKTSYRKIFNDFSSNLADSVDASEIILTYYSGLAYLDYMQMNYYSAMVSLKNSYSLNNENLRTRELIQNVFIKMVYKDFLHHQLVDTIDKYFREFPFLESNELFLAHYGYCHLRSILNSFNTNEPTRGENYLKRFEEAYKKYPGMQLDPDLVASAFLGAAGYYFRVADLKTVMAYLNAGLKYAPESFELKEASMGLSEYRKLNSVTYIEAPKEIDLLKEFIEKDFAGCWRTVAVVENDKESAPAKQNNLHMNLTSNRKVSYTYGNEKKEANWSVRTNSRLLYFSNPRNPDEYIVFYVKEFSRDELILRPFIENKDRAKYMLKLKRCNE